MTVVAIPLIAFLAITATLYFQGRQQEQAEQQARRIFQVRNQIRTVLTLLLEAETGVHGYVLSGREEFLDPFSRAFGDLQPAVAQMEKLVGNNPEQLARAERVEFLMGQKLIVLGELRSMASRGRSPSRQQQALLVESNDVMNQLRNEIDAMQREEERRLQAQLNEVDEAEAREPMIFAIAGAAALGGALVAVLVFVTGIAHQISRAEENATHLALEEPLAPGPGGNDEVGRLSRAIEAAAELLHDRTRRLRDAKEEAEQASGAKSEFLSRTSHELRTPLNAILGFAQLMQLGTLDANQERSVDQILKAGHHLLDLINDVLDIARIEAGEMSLYPQPVSLREAVDEATALIAPTAQARGITLTTQADENLDRCVLADKQRLKQVLLNLLSNAIKYNEPDGKVSIAILPEEEQARVEVADTGPGIRPEAVERLFTPFDRLGIEPTHPEGIGLGLALSRRLMEMMGGEIGVRTKLGEGSTFWVELPIVEGSMEGVKVDPRALIETDRVPEKRVNVLYVEDNDANVRLVEQLLTHRPEVQLTSTGSGQAGLEIARKEMPDLVLLDLTLPDIRGEQVLKEMRDDPQTHETRVVVLSADATDKRLHDVLDSGADAYLTKPLNVAEFFRIIDDTAGVNR